MRIVIVGGRDFTDYKLLCSYLDQLHTEDITCIISGGAAGADSLAERYAKYYGIPMEVYKPDWHTHGKAAGFLRNQTIVNHCDKVLAFWDGKSRGTADTIAKAKVAGKPVLIVRY